MTTTTSSSTEATPKASAGWGGLVLRLHFYAGLLVGPFVLIATITGVLYVLTPQLESWLYADLLRVPPSAQQLPVSEQVRLATADPAARSARLVAVRPAPEPGATTRVLFAEPGLGESERFAVFVDPGTGTVTGSAISYGSSGALPLRTTIDNLHRNLLLGEPGRLYSELAASWMWVVALGGLALWIARRRRQRRTPAVPRMSGRGRRVARHGALGLWLLTGMLFLSATGLTWSTYAGATISDLRAALSWSTPQLNVAGHSEHGAAAAVGPVDAAIVDGVLAAARAGGIDAGQVEVALPAKPGAAWTVTEIQRAWPTQVDAVAVDAATATVLDEVRFADYPLVAKLARWGIDAHMGVLFGWVNQVVLVGFGIGLITLIVLGYRMWWTRRPIPGRGGRPVPRGQLRRAGRPAAVVAVVAAAGVGWFAPLFGISLLAFLVVDVLLGYRARRRPVPN